MKIIEQEEVRKLLQPKDCIQLMAEALKGLESGEYAQPARLITVMPNTAKFGFMPAYVGDYFGAKVISAFAPNMGTKYPSHIGYVMLFESAHSTVAGMIEAGSITEIRTGAVSAAATDLLARKDSHKLALIGAGAQARSHLQYRKGSSQRCRYHLHRNTVKRTAFDKGNGQAWNSYQCSGYLYTNYKRGFF